MIVIPARGGSKRLPRKNLIPLGGKPLIRHSIDTALECKIFGKVLVTTDDPEIAAVSLQAEGVTVDNRPSALAADTTKSIEVMLEICRREEIENAFDAIGMLLPTCPLRNSRDVINGFGMLTDETDSVVSFTEYEYSPLCAIRIEQGDVMKPVYEPSPLFTETRTQDHEPMYKPNGGFYFSWITSLNKLESFYTGRVRSYVMPRSRSIDIDTEEDFALAEWMLRESFGLT
ncbi:MAG: acylneuraminate cytidylyltransferase family protein [Rhodospirillaceae bacterium]